jgi:glycosyltransferase involved in cell wall biosynthesis
VKVGIITTSYPRFPGDFAGSFVADLAAALGRAGLSVEVWAPHAPGLAEREVAEGVMVHRFRYAPGPLERVAYGDGIANNIKRNPMAALGLPGFVRALKRAGRQAAQRCDIVHVNWVQTAAMVADANLPVPMVVTAHGTDVRLARGGGRMLRELRRGVASPPVAEVIAVSEELARELRGLAHSRAEVTVVPTGVEADLLDRERLLRHAKGPLRITYVGRLLTDKGVHDLAEAFIALDRDATLTIVGGGPEEGPLAWRFLEAGVEQRVTFTGAVPRPAALDAMADADVVVVPSHAEGCGVVAIEASALGVPVVATRVGVHPELLRRDELLFDAGDVPTLVARLRRLADDPALRGHFGERGRARVAEAYTWDALAGRIVEVYRRALEQDGA